MALSIESVSKRYKDVTVIDNLSLSVFPGEIMGLLGPTGAGKSTLLKLTAGHVMPDKGDIFIEGTDLHIDFEGCMKNLGYVPERPEFYQYMSGMNNLITVACLYGSPDMRRLKDIISGLYLDEYIEEKVSGYPAGAKQRLAIAAALVNSPRLLLLDEAFDGLDPISVIDLRKLLRRFANEYGMAVLITSHQMNELEKLCDRIAIINQGVLIGTGSVEKLKNASSNKLRHRILLDRPEAAAPFICEAAGVVTEVRGDAIIVDADQSMIPTIISMLYSRGHLVYEITPIEMTLEEAYYRMLRVKAAGRREAYERYTSPYDGGVSYE